MSGHMYSLCWGRPHAEVFSELLSSFHSAGLRFFILRNYQGLPESNESKDVDIIIEPGSYKKAASLLREVLGAHRFTHLRTIRYERAWCFYAMAPERRLSIHLDLIEGYVHRGFEIFPFTELYAHTRPYRNFRVLEEDYHLLLLLYYKVIGSKSLKERYRVEIQSAYAEAKEQVDVLLQRTLGLKLGLRVSALLEKGNYDTLIGLSPHISVATKRYALARSPGLSLLRLARFCMEKIHRVGVCPPSMRQMVAVLGTDGVGKSTFLDALMKRIDFYYGEEGCKCRLYHHRPGLLPNLGALGEKMGGKSPDTDFSHPHRGARASLPSSLLRMGYYWLDYVLGVAWLLRRSAHSDRYTVFDRYIYDFLIDPYRSRIQLPYALRSLFIALAPEPRLVFVLIADAATIYARKQELPLEEIERQQEALKRLAESDPRFVILDANENPDAMADKAMLAVLDTFAERLP